VYRHIRVKISKDMSHSFLLTWADNVGVISGPVARSVVEYHKDPQ
jgi:hypothetical protein